MGYLETAKKIEQEAKLKRLYQNSTRKFEDRWAVGLYDRIERENPSLTAQINAARGKLDDVWIGIRHGRAGIPEFRKALQDWENLHLKAVNQEDSKRR